MAGGYSRRRKKDRSKTSIKDGQSKHAGPKLKKTVNLGLLMRKYSKVEDVLYEFTVGMGLVFEDMDCTIEEFSDMTGVDVEEITEAVTKAIKAS